MIVGGPMFEPAQTEFWKSVSGKSGAHYNNYGCRDEHGMSALREMFPDGAANEMNLVLFSTSGVHGTYATIEEVEAVVARGFKDEDGEERTHPTVTFLIVHPRICCVRHGNCEPRTPEDFAFIKGLRHSSWKAARQIGRAE